MFLGIDIGTSGTKTIAIDGAGTKLAEAMQEYPCQHLRPLWSEQDPEDWWQATVATVRKVMNEAGLKPAEIKAIGLSGQMHGAVFLDRHGKVIRPAILWNDQRTTAECNEIEDRAGGRSNLLKMVASPALTGFTAPKILWLRKNEPANWERVHRVLLPKDEIRRRLTGEYATDVSDASGTLLFDVKNRTWSKTLMDRLQLDVDLMPACFESAESTGKLSKEVAELLGLTTDCIVAGGAGDCPAGAVGNGIVKSGVASTLIGTSSVFLVHSDTYNLDQEGRLHTFCHAVSGKWFIMGVNLSGGGCMQWFRNQLCQAEVSQLEHAEQMYEKLSAEAAEIDVGCEGLMFLPYLSGERHPHNDADARGCFIGLTLAHTRAHMVRAIMEGVGYNMRESMALVEAMNIPIKQVLPSGGGSRSELWRKIQQNMFNKPFARVRCDQGPAFGAALLAAVAAGSYKSVEEACEATIAIDAEDLSCKSTSSYYAKGFPIFQHLYRSLKHDFKRLSALATESRELEPAQS
ncbi:MAG TPA: xylulokinase [Planktothrix sp.]